MRWFRETVKRRTVTRAIPGTLWVGAMAIAGCAGSNSNTITPTGRHAASRTKAVRAGYGTNANPWAQRVQLDRVQDTSPVGAAQVYVATVRDTTGRPIAGRRVEWIITDGGTGDLLDVDETGSSGRPGYKVNNHYGVSYTGSRPRVLDRGTDDPTDDVHLTAGQTWCVINSPVEGTTHLTAYAPSVYNWDLGKTVARHRWLDVDWEMPPVTTEPVGGRRVLSCRVFRHSDGTPLADYVVRYEIVGGPESRFERSNNRTIEVRTDQDGWAEATLRQDSPVEGTNDVRLSVIRPADIQCCNPALTVAEGGIQQHWMNAHVMISKSAPVERGAGQVFVTPILVSNTAAVDARDVIVTDEVPEGMEYVSSVPEAEVNGGQLRWNVGRLPAHGRRQFEVTLRGNRRGRFGGYAEVRAANGLVDRDYAETVIRAPQLALSFNGPSHVTACDPITYTITVVNNGDGAAHDVQVTGTLAKGLIVQSGHRADAFVIGTLAPGQARTVSFKVEPDHDGKFNNRARAESSGGFSAEAATTTMVDQPRLIISKSGPAERYIGRDAEFEIQVTNTGETPARDVVVTDAVPAGLTFLRASHRGRLVNRQVRWEIPVLDPGETLTVSHTDRATTSGMARSTAWVRANCADASTTSQVAISGVTAILMEVTDTNDPIEVGDMEMYDIRVTNQGSANATAINVVCELPEGQEFVSGTGPSQAHASGNRITFSTLPVLGPQQHALYRVTVKSSAAGDVRFKTTVDCDQLDEPVIETESTFMY